MMAQHVREQRELMMQLLRAGEHPQGHRVWLTLKLAPWAKDKWKDERNQPGKGSDSEQ